jgi:NAD(P)-dependent dehydrogenase (short-subunit alcohol dehydrogenase family)
VLAEINGTDGYAEVGTVDAFDQDGVEAHLNRLLDDTGRLDISFNESGIAQPGIQGIPLLDLPVESFMLPVGHYLRSNFLTARAAARRMTATGSGVILMHTPEPARLGAQRRRHGTGVGGHGGADPFPLGRLAARESVPSASVPRGSETSTIDVVFDLHARALGVKRQDFLRMSRVAPTGSARRRSPSWPAWRCSSPPMAPGR